VCSNLCSFGLWANPAWRAIKEGIIINARLRRDKAINGNRNTTIILNQTKIDAKINREQIKVSERAKDPNLAEF
jgi:hypothetical protein